MRIWHALLVSFALSGCDEDSSAQECREGDEQCEAIEEFCSRADECEHLELLISVAQCQIQTGQQLSISSSPDCREKTAVASTPVTGKTSATLNSDCGKRDSSLACSSCVTDLTCAGMGEVAQGKISLRELCPACPQRFGTLRENAFLLVPGLSPAPVASPEVEETESVAETAAPENAPAKGVTPPPPTGAK